ncbi:MAG: RHS repeat-associated core domain-containing protein, partial [Capsulimonadaceae bacterium]|nr:RHS repeat-associated core domain-containing protein [Capsulimonadaceae bacterium]
AYDGAGNPTTLRNNAGLSYNADNQLSTDSFDGNGNPTTYSGTAATYNADNELAAYGSALTRDPTGTAGGVNEYAYCGGNPVNGSDPSGGWIRRKIPYVRRGAAGIGAPRNTGSPMTRDPLVSRSRSAPRAG